MEPDDYIAVETNLDGYSDDDYDVTPDEDMGELSQNTDNKIPTSVTPGENDRGNNSKDSNDTSISGTVKDDQGNVLVGATLELQRPGGSTAINTTANDAYCFCIFTIVEPGIYNTKQMNPARHPLDVDVSDYDGDYTNFDRTVDNIIDVPLTLLL